MATVGELRQQLAAKGYASRASTPADLGAAPQVSVHTHPLITNPVVLLGADSDQAKSYQQAAVTQALTRR